MDAASAAVSLRVNGAEIEVFDGFPGDPEATCTPDTPTVTNTSAITIADTAAMHDTLFNIELVGGPFEPGADTVGEGSGVREIEIEIEGGDNAGNGDTVSPVGGTGAENWRFGALTGSASGANLNAPEAAMPDGDDLRMTGIEFILAFGDPVVGATGAGDTITANGSTELGALTLPASFVGDEGDDELTAGNANTFLGGGEADDTMTGGPGNDQMRLAFGDDIAAGHGGTDMCSYLNQDGDVTADLRIATQQDTGAGGLDTLTGCEDLEGGDDDDTLIGTNGPNLLRGGENTPGLEFGADTLVGLGGNDTLSGSDGADLLQIRDGGPDTANCGNPNPGPPPDRVVADRKGVDTIAADCEQVSFLPAAIADIDPPQTSIDRGPKRKTRKRKATIAFSSDEPGSSFECALDGEPFAACTSPFVDKVKRRRHEFGVRATDAAGNTDGTPAEIGWKVKKKRK